MTQFNAAGSALVYSTYLGGSNDDYAYGIAVDSSGNAYVTGITESSDFPTANPFQPSNGSTILADGGANAFVTKLNPAGSALVYSTYLGGNNTDYGHGIAVNSSGSAYVTGMTESTNFPTANPFQASNASTNIANGGGNAFVTKFNASGSALVYSTYLGGSNTDSGLGIAVDSFGNAYVTGYTNSTNFPTENPIQTYQGGNDAFVAELNATGAALVYSTHLGGSNHDYGYGIGVDSSGNAYVAGLTLSSNFPTVDPLDATDKNGHGTAFITKISSPQSAPITISPATIAPGTAGVQYSPVTFTTTGGQGTVTLSESGSLPSGMTFSNGVLSGTPEQTGSYPITLSAADSQSDTGSENLTLVINCPTIVVAPSSLAVGMVGTANPPVTFTESGGVGAITFAETGTLPTGMTFVAGVLSGTPTQAGSFSITVSATDSNGCSGNVTDPLTINPSTVPPPRRLRIMRSSR